jgi:hypothetical protein
MRTLLILGILLICASTLKPEQEGTPKNTPPDVPDISTISGFNELCGNLDDPNKQQKVMFNFAAPYCIGWVNGFVHGVLIGEVFDNHPLQVCLPQGNSFGQMVRVIKKFIADHPEEEHRGTEVLALWALEQAFPCKK